VSGFQRRIQPPNANETQIHLRLPRALHEALKRAAADAGVSLNVYLNRVAQQHLQRRQQHP